MINPSAHRTVTAIAILSSFLFSPRASALEGTGTQENPYAKALKALDEVNRNGAAAFAEDERQRALERGRDRATPTPAVKRSGPPLPKPLMESFNLSEIVRDQALRAWRALEGAFELAAQHYAAAGARSQALAEEARRSTQGNTQLPRRQSGEGKSIPAGESSNSTKPPSGIAKGVAPTKSDPTPPEQSSATTHSDPTLGALASLGIDPALYGKTGLDRAEPPPADTLRSGGASINSKLADGEICGPFSPPSGGGEGTPITLTFGIGASGSSQFASAQKIANGSGRDVYLAYNEFMVERAAQVG